MDEARAYLSEMERSRGYVLPYHAIMATEDFATLKAANQLVDATYLKSRTLSPATKELIFIVSLTVLKASLHHIESHIRAATELGVGRQAILEALEIALPEAGVVAFQHGLEAWANVFSSQDPYGDQQSTTST